MRIRRASDIAKITPPAKGNDRHPVDGCPALYLKVTAKGARAWTFRYRPRGGPKAGADREYTIGRYPEFGIMEARERWRKLYKRVRDGEDPLAEIEEARDAPTMRELAERYLEKVASGKKSGDADERTVRRLILPALGSFKVEAVTYQDCEQLNRSLKATPVMANRTLTIVKLMFKLAIREGWRGDNPAALVEAYSEKGRERYLTDDEYPRLFQALQDEPDQRGADFIRLLLLTGARSGEVSAMRWQDVDLASATWKKPTTKTGRSHLAALSAPAMEIIARQPRDGERVFPRVVRHVWARVRTAAGIEDVHLHDLRHSAASLLVSDGISLKVIGEVLGHAAVSSTNRYSHVDLRARRAAAEHLGRKLTEKQNGMKRGA